MSKCLCSKMESPSIMTLKVTNYKKTLFCRHRNVNTEILTAYTESVQYQARWVSALWGGRGEWVTIPNQKKIYTIKTCWQRDNQFSLMGILTHSRTCFKPKSSWTKQYEPSGIRGTCFVLLSNGIYVCNGNKWKQRLTWIWKITNRKLL